MIVVLLCHLVQETPAYWEATNPPLGGNFHITDTSPPLLLPQFTIIRQVYICPLESNVPI